MSTAIEKASPYQMQKWAWEDHAHRRVEATVRLVQETVAKGFNPEECLMLIVNCMGRGLNPFTKDMMLVRYQERGPAALITAYQTLLAQADRTGEYIQPEIHIDCDDAGKPLKGWARARRASWPEGVWAYYPAQGNEISFASVTKGQAEWNRAPYHMFWKTLVARVIRVAFPAATQGMYLSEEFGVPENAAPPALEASATYLPPPGPPATDVAHAAVAAPPLPPDLGEEPANPAAAGGGTQSELADPLAPEGPTPSEAAAEVPTTPRDVARHTCHVCDRPLTLVQEKAFEAHPLWEKFAPHHLCGRCLEDAVAGRLPSTSETT